MASRELGLSTSPVVASKISRIYGHDLSRKRKSDADARLVGQKANGRERRAYSFAPADSWTIARREEGIIETEITVETTRLAGA